MKRMFSGLQRRVTFPTSPPHNNNSSSTSPAGSGDESPEETIVREITAFCEANGGPNRVANDYLHLPAIVEAAESSAVAAKEAAARIRKYLSSPSKPEGSAQYNAVMLIRILAENPGHTFTRNMDAKFVSTIKDLLREGRDMSTQHMLRETLDMFESQRSWDEDLSALLAMWKKEKARSEKYAQRAQPRYLPPGPPAQAYGGYHQYHHHHHHAPRPRQLPPPEELAARVSEAKTSANLLIQLSQSTPAAEVKDHELLKEFAERCSGASRSIQGYMAVENPPPDEDTMLTLIETNEHLSVALSKYQRAVLNARRALANTANDNRNTTAASNGNTTNGRSADAAAARAPPAPPSRQDSSSSPPMIEEVPALPPLRTNEEPLLSHSAFPERSLTQHSTTAATTTTTTTTTTPAQTAPRRYEYDAGEFQVENPFADSATTEHDRHSISSADHA